jgi:hypothetical protein
MSPDQDPRRKLGDRPDFDQWSDQVMGALRDRGRDNGQQPADAEATAPSARERAPVRLWRRLRAGLR